MTATVDDEAFWQHQQKRREKQFGQPCCTQSGMSWTMIDMPGNFAVVIHGEYDCLNCFHHHVGRSAFQYYSTRLTEEMLTTGRTEAALRECLELVARHQRPEVVIVLGTCPVEVIGDQFGPVVQAVSAETGIPMIPLRTSGLALSSQQQMLDWLFKTLATLPPAPPVDRTWQREVALLAMDALFGHHAGSSDAAALVARLRAAPSPRVGGSARVNLVGMPHVAGAVPEPVVLLASAGVDVNGSYPEGASITEWRAIRHAQAALVSDVAMYPRLLEVLARDHHQAIVEVPIPVGLGASLRLYEAIGAATDRLDAVRAAITPAADAARAAIDAGRARVAGAKVGVTIRMLANYRSDNLAYDGLGEVEALTELGLDVHLFVQGPPEDGPREQFAAQLAARGNQLPFTVFPGPWVLGDYLRDAGCDLVVSSDTVRNEARAVGVPHLPTGSLRPYLQGVPAIAEAVSAALADRRRA